MWARNLLFLIVALLGISILAASITRPVQAPQGRRASDGLGTPAAVQLDVATLDNALRKRWNEKAVAPAPPVDDLQMARRLALGLAGTIPSLEEIRQFEAEPAEQRRGWWVEHLLSESRTSDYLAERFARAFVGVEDGPFLVYRRRRFVAWLAEQFARNRPYDELVREMISTDGLWTDQPGTNFVTVAMRPDADDGLDTDRLAWRTARVLLGVRLDCAQCHDHPFAPWRQRDFAGLAAFFAEARTSLVGLHDRPVRTAPARDAAEEPLRTSPAVPFAAELLPEQGDRRVRLAVWVTHPENKAFARATVNRVWAMLCGRPLVAPLDDLPLGQSVHPALELLSRQFVASGYDLRHLVRTIALSEAFQLAQHEHSGPDPEEHASKEPHDHWTEFPVTPLRPEQVAGAIGQATSLETIDGDSRFLARFIKRIEQGEFVERYVDRGEQELEVAATTIPQRLLMMNGKLVREATAESLNRAPARIAQLAPDARTLLDVAFLVVLTRRPTSDEYTQFLPDFEGVEQRELAARVEDLFWALFNSTEFAWNH